MRSQTTHRTLVLGGGYTGAVAAIRLAGRARGRTAVTLVNPRPTLIQRLRLHQVAAGQQVAAPALERLAGGRAVDVVVGTATDLEPDAGRVTVTGDGGARRLSFDALVLATGSTGDLDSIAGARRHAHSVADPAAAQRLSAAVAALGSGSTIAVGGGGFTGLEAATELAHARPDLRVLLVTGGDVGGPLSERGRGYLHTALARLGVEVVERAHVARVEHGALVLADGAEVPCELAVWCGGFVASPLARDAGLAVDGRGRVVVDQQLRSASHPQVLAAGDAGNAARMTCQAGMPAGAHAADVVAAGVRGRPEPHFDFGFIHMPLSLGRRDGLVQFVDRADRPRNRILTGRTAAAYKEVVTSGGVHALRLERWLPGATMWPKAQRPSGSRCAGVSGASM